MIARPRRELADGMSALDECMVGREYGDLVVAVEPLTTAASSRFHEAVPSFPGAEQRRRHSDEARSGASSVLRVARPCAPSSHPVSLNTASAGGQTGSTKLRTASGLRGRSGEVFK